MFGALRGKCCLLHKRGEEAGLSSGPGELSFQRRLWCFPSSLTN